MGVKFHCSPFVTVEKEEKKREEQRRGEGYGFFLRSSPTSIPLEIFPSFFPNGMLGHKLCIVATRRQARKE